MSTGSSPPWSSPRRASSGPPSVQALYSGDPEEIQAFIDYYNRVNGVREYTLEACKRLFGVGGVPEGVERELEVR